MVIGSSLFNLNYIKIERKHLIKSQSQKDQEDEKMVLGASAAAVQENPAAEMLDIANDALGP